jgi:Phage integrase family/Helix-turn-helix domain
VTGELTASDRAVLGTLGSFAFNSPWAWPSQQTLADVTGLSRRRGAGERTHRACDPLPEGLSPHALRRTFASWLVAEGEDAAYVMAQLGHTDPKMTLGLYARALTSKRRRAHGARPDEAPGRARMGAEGVDDDGEAVDAIDAAGPEPAI